MKKDRKKERIKDEKGFMVEYEKIMKSSKKSVVIETQWAKEGDYFQKLSMYDESYITVNTTLGGTTLINTL